MPDVPICTEITTNKGYCTNIVTNHEFFVDDQHMYIGKDKVPRNWQGLKSLSVTVPPDSWVAIRAYLIKECERNSNCM